MYFWNPGAPPCTVLSTTIDPMGDFSSDAHQRLQPDNCQPDRPHCLPLGSIDRPDVRSTTTSVHASIDRVFTDLLYSHMPCMLCLDTRHAAQLRSFHVSCSPAGTPAMATRLVSAVARVANKGHAAVIQKSTSRYRPQEMSEFRLTRGFHACSQSTRGLPYLQSRPRVL